MCIRDRDNTRTRKRLELTLETQENLTPFEAFRAFYEDVAKMPLTGAEEALLEKTLNQLTEDKERCIRDRHNRGI